MSIETAAIILKLVELGMTYGPGIVTARIEAMGTTKETITMEDLDILEASLKHPSQYMPRPDGGGEG